MSALSVASSVSASSAILLSATRCANSCSSDSKSWKLTGPVSSPSDWAASVKTGSLSSASAWMGVVLFARRAHGVFESAASKTASVGNVSVRWA